MTAVSDRPILVDEPVARPREPRGRIIVSWITSTDHKVIGYMYLITSFVFFLFGGVMALLMRAELARPGLQFLSNEQYNQLFTMHGTIMLLMFATPLFIGFGNVIMPLQIGSPDVAFPRMNMLSYWLFIFGGLIVVGGFLTPGGAAAFGWFAYAPLNDVVHSPGVGADMWIIGLALSGLGTILGGVNFITTVLTMRAPGMTMFRMPIFTWNIFVTSVLVLLAFPVLAAALLALEVDRAFGAHVFDATNGGPILWQHLFWFFGHPEVYIIALPFFGIVSEIIPVFSRKPIFGYKGLVFATLAIACAVGGGVGAPHVRHRVGPAAVLRVHDDAHRRADRGEVLQLDRHDVARVGALDTPMLWTIGFLVTFLFGGLTGIILSSPPLDFQVSDSYFVVAHFHYVVFGTVVFAMFAGFYFWWPKMTGRMLDERLGKVHFWLLFIGFHTTFLIQHWLGVEGMPRRFADYLAADGFTTLNTHLDRRRVHPGRLDAPVPLQRRQDRQARAQGHRRRPVGLGPFAGVGDVLPAAAAQLRPAAADPLGVAGVRPAPPRARAGRRRAAGPVRRSRGR